MPPKKELCRNFARGSCQYGDRCKFLHVSPQQSKPNPFGFGTQTGQQQSTNFQQQNSNPFNVQNNFQTRAANDFGSKQNQYKWTRNTDGAAKKQPDNQPAAQNHQCTDGPEACKRQIMEDFQQEKPMWKLTCYGHSKNGPCDIVGDTSYEELRASAYNDAKNGLSLQSIVEKERNLMLSKVREFESLLNNHSFKGLPSTHSPLPFPTATAQTPSVAAQRTDPPLLSSFSQLGQSLNTVYVAWSFLLGFECVFLLVYRAPAAAPNSVFGQSNLFQNNNQMTNLPNPNAGFGGQPQGTIQSPFTSGFAPFGNNSTSNVQNHTSNSGFGGQPQGTVQSPSTLGFAGFNNKSTSGLQNHVSNSGLGGQPQGTVQSPLMSAFGGVVNNTTSNVQNQTPNSGFGSQNLGFGSQPQGTAQSSLPSGFGGFGNVQNQTSNSSFGSLPQGTVQSPSTLGFGGFNNNSTSSVQNQTSNSGFGFSSFGNKSTSNVPNQVSAPTFASQIPLQVSSPLSKMTGGDDGIWLKQEWGIGEIPEEAPPEVYCN